jgi:hypothetical protein
MQRLLPCRSKSPLLTTAAVVAASLSLSLGHGQADFAAPLTWKKLAQGVNERFASSAVFDPNHESVLLYGGETHVQGKFGIWGDLWEYKTADNTWRAIDAKGATPPSRAYHSTAFDAKQGIMWMFGGTSAKLTALDDLWKLDTATMTWTAMTPSGARPGARFSAGLFHDAARNQLVLYSGCKSFIESDNAWPDVWTYDIERNVWSKKKATAPPRWQAAAAFAPELDLLIVQGGFDGKSNAHADTWTYSLADDKWAEAGKGFKASEAQGAVWDPIARAMIVYGGTSGAKVGLDQVWAFDAKSRKWSRLAAKGEGPGGRAYHSVVWNPIEKSLWRFGGTLNQFMDEPRKNEAWSLQLHR